MNAALEPQLSWDMSAFRLSVLTSDIRHAHVSIQQCTIDPERGAVTLMYDAAAFNDEGEIRYAQNLLRILLYENCRKTLLTNNLAQRGQ